MKHPSVSTQGKTGFNPLYLWMMMGLAAIGGVAIVLSLIFHPNIKTRVNVLNQRKPMKVLVGIQGTSTNPVFIGFLAVVSPRSQVLTVVPISGRIPVVYAGVNEPLYQAVSSVPAKKASLLVQQATRIPIHHYFFITPKDLMLVLHALYYHSHHWPKNQTPLTMLSTLGYPDGRIAPKKEIQLLSTIVTQLPLVNPIETSTLLTIPKTSVTNLSSYQLFLLANYIRGDALKPGNIGPYQIHRRRSHG